MGIDAAEDCYYARWKQSGVLCPPDAHSAPKENVLVVEFLIKGLVAPIRTDAPLVVTISGGGFLNKEVPVSLSLEPTPHDLRFESVAPDTLQECATFRLDYYAMAGSQQFAGLVSKPCDVKRRAQ